MNPKLIGTIKVGPESGLRPDTPLYAWAINFIFNDGGMGDFVNYTGATTWLEKNNPWVDGRIFVPRYLKPLLEDIHKRFKVYASEDFNEVAESGTSYLGPSIVVGGVNTSQQLLTCMGAHPFDVGFAYYAHSTPPPFEAELPVLDYPASRLPPKIKRAGRYAVIPCGNTAEARAPKGRHLNPIISHIKSKGLTPIFLGKKDLLGDGVQTTNFPGDINYAAGIDMRNETSVKDAATIMQHAELTVGLDCGLLHVAALMRDSKIIFGYNITTVAHREPKRSHGHTINIALKREDLACIACQSTLKNIAVHKFNRCLYGDNKCIELLFADSSKRWLDAIDEMLK